MYIKYQMRKSLLLEMGIGVFLDLENVGKLIIMSFQNQTIKEMHHLWLIVPDNTQA